MTEILVKTYIPYSGSEHVKESFSVRGVAEHASRGARMKDIDRVVGALAADLARAEPPLYDGFEEDIRVSVLEGHRAYPVVVATFDRTDTRTTNVGVLDELRYLSPQDLQPSL